jgi:DNA-binding protein HU-beta
MNKQELVQYVADYTGTSKAAAERAVNGVMAGITDTLKRGDKLVLVGFGTFAVNKRAERNCSHPRTGKIIKIAASKRPAFKPGKTLNKQINGA